MKYTKIFNTKEEYDSYKGGPNYIIPNLSLILEDNSLKFMDNNTDIVVWDGSKRIMVNKNKWTPSIGTPVGVVVIPENFLPDGKSRIVSFKPINKNGNFVDDDVFMKWCENWDSNTINNSFNTVPITDNNNNENITNFNYGYLPSDNFNGEKSIIDNKSKYNNNEYLIPSPYLNDKLNPSYKKHALSDFNGFENTKKLINSTNNYEAAISCWNCNMYSLQWYLPSVGELGLLLTRLNHINNVIRDLGGVKIDENEYYWTSTSCGTDGAYYICTSDGLVDYYAKDLEHYVRPFAKF